MLDLSGKVALVMGCGAVADGWGNGRATATLFARQGARVFGTDLHLGHARETQRLNREEGHEIDVMACDGEINHGQGAWIWLPGAFDAS